MSAHRYQKLKKLLQKEHLRRLTRDRCYLWENTARPNQLPPSGDWHTWLILAGRGFGKTRTGAETVRLWVKTGQARRIALIGKTVIEARKIMVEGASGLLSIYPEPERPLFHPSRRQVSWRNGAVATLYGADHFEHLRGPQFDTAWIDEFAKFRYVEALWEQVLLSLRLGESPRCLITTTPRPLKLLEKLIADPTVVVTKGSTFENRDNLAPSFINRITRQFDGTSLGAQELYAQLLTEHEGALWRRALIHHKEPACTPEGGYILDRIVVAVDPATTHTQTSDETGIIVAGLDATKKGYILNDLSGRFSPHEWGSRVVMAFREYKADRVVVETNKGGDLVGNVIKSLDPHVPIKEVRATRGKSTRAEPIAALYEQKKIYHTRPFSQLESQLCDYCPGVTAKSPDRLDALVWALTELFLEAENRPHLRVWDVPV